MHTTLIDVQGRSQKEFRKGGWIWVGLPFTLEVFLKYIFRLGQLGVEPTGVHPLSQ